MGITRTLTRELRTIGLPIHCELTAIVQQRATGQLTPAGADRELDLLWRHVPRDVAHRTAIDAVRTLLTDRRTLERARSDPAQVIAEELRGVNYGI